MHGSVRELNEAALDAVEKVLNAVRNSTTAIQEKQKHADEMEALMRQNAEKVGSIIKLQVGGKLFETYRENLLRTEGNYFHAMLSSGHWQPNEDGVYVIDRYSDGFERILEFLSSGKLSFVGLSRESVVRLEENMDYFQISAPRKSWEYNSSVELKACSAGVTCVMELTDGRLCSGSLDGTIRLWDASTANCTKSITCPEGANIWSVVQLDEDHICIGTFEHTVDVYMLSGTIERSMTDHEQAVVSLVVLEDGTLCSASFDSTLRLWHPLSGTCEKVITGHTGFVWCVIQLRDGRLCSASSDGLIKVWSVSTGACELTLDGQSGPVYCVLELSDTRIVSAHESGEVLVWSLATSSVEKRLTGHSKAVRSLAQLFDGRLCTGSNDCTLRLWNLESGACLKLLEGHTGAVHAVIELKDGRLCSASEDTIIKIWS